MATDLCCVIFDLDGTLVDSEGLCQQGYLDLIPELTDTLDEMLQRYRGAQLAPILADIEERTGIKLPANFEPIYRARVNELFDAHLRPMPGVEEMLAGLTSSYGLASNGPLQKMRHGLHASGLSPYFRNNLFSAYEVNSWKPDPGLFLHAAGEMGYPAHRCAVVEDSKVGLEAALAAGMHTIYYQPHKDPAHEDPSMFTIRHMSELSPLLKELATEATRQE